MSIALLDVNALLALLWKNHVFHERMMQWFSENAQKGWATCPITEQGFVRIISNTSTISPAPRVPVAMDLLQKVIETSTNHEFWADDLPLSGLSATLRNRLQGHKQITDAYLLALAVHRKGMLVTFDFRIAALAPIGSVEHDSLHLLRL
jgi:hypothetical protein